MGKGGAGEGALFDLLLGAQATGVTALGAGEPNTCGGPSSHSCISGLADGGKAQ